MKRYTITGLLVHGVELFSHPPPFSLSPRELLCHSLEGRRIDLITVTSWEGVTGEREARIPHLFPDEMAERCHGFKDKKVQTDRQIDRQMTDKIFSLDLAAMQTRLSQSGT